MMIGLGLYLVWYGLLLTGGVVAGGSWWHVAILFGTAYLSGVFTLKYLSWSIVSIRKLKVMRLKSRNRNEYNSLIKTRNIIVKELDKLRVEYVNS